MSFWPNPQTTVLVSALLGVISAYLAHRRGRNPLLWFLIGFLFGAFGIISFFFIPQSRKKRGPARSRATLRGREISVRPKAETLPQPYLLGPKDKFWYYLDEAREQIGPMSHSGITGVWKEGKISPETFVWHEDLTDWMPLEALVRTPKQTSPS